MFFCERRARSQNREVALEAVEQGKIEIRKHENGELYL